MNIHDIYTPNQVSKVLGNLSRITLPFWTVWFWFGWPYLLYSEFLFTTLARITSAALKWQSAKQLVVVSLIHVVKERNLNKSLSEYQEGLSIYFTLVPVLDFSMKNDVSSFPNVTTAEYMYSAHIPETSEWVTPIL